MFHKYWSDVQWWHANVLFIYKFRPDNIFAMVA